MNKKIGPHSSLEDMLQAAVYAVEANSFEYGCLWREYHHKVKWEEILSGYMPTIGRVDDRPVNLSIRVAYIDGQPVLFYEACSEIVDYKMVDAWVREHVLGDTKMTGCVNKCDANNFHICLRAVREMNESAVSAQAA